MSQELKWDRKRQEREWKESKYLNHATHHLKNITPSHSPIFC